MSNRAEEDLHGPAGHYLLAKIYLSRGNLDKARSHFQSAVTRDNTLWPARLELEAIAAGGAVRAGLGGRLFGRKGSAGTSPQNRASLESDGTTDDLTDKGHGGAPSTPRSMVGDAVTVATGWATQLANHAILLWAFVVYVGSRNGVLVTICLAFLNYLRGNGWQLRLPR